MAASRWHISEAGEEIFLLATACRVGGSSSVNELLCPSILGPHVVIMLLDFKGPSSKLSCQDWFEAEVESQVRVEVGLELDLELDLGECLCQHQGCENCIEVLNLDFPIHEGLSALGGGGNGFEYVVGPILLKYKLGKLSEILVKGKGVNLSLISLVPHNTPYLHPLRRKFGFQKHLLCKTPEHQPLQDVCSPDPLWLPSETRLKA